MSRPFVQPTNREIGFREDELIVSKTDKSGKILYANTTFFQVSGYTEKETLGQPHNFIRSHKMPRCIFKLMWETLQTGQELFAYVNNLTKHGDHYWVNAHVTPSFDKSGQIIGYHSNRRVPDRDRILEISQIYETLLLEEKKHSSPKEGLTASYKLFNEILSNRGQSYEQFIHVH